MCTQTVRQKNTINTHFTRLETRSNCLVVSSHVLTPKQEAKHGCNLETAVCLFHEAAKRATFGLFICV